MPFDDTSLRGRDEEEARGDEDGKPADEEGAPADVCEAPEDTGDASQDSPEASDAPGDTGGSGIVSFPAGRKRPQRKGKPSAEESAAAVFNTEAGGVMDASQVPQEPVEAPAPSAPDLAGMEIAPGGTEVISPPQAPEGAIAVEPAEAATAAADQAPTAEAPPRAVDRALVRRLVEGALFTAPGPLSAAKLAGVASDLTAQNVRLAVDDLNAAYRAGDHAFLIEEIAGGYRMLTRKELGGPLGEFFAKRSKDKLSRAALETLASVAYKQPVTRATVESIRGVVSDSVVANLIELGLVRVSGQAETPGRPILYSTTKKFLDHFGLKSLRDLPREKDFDAMEKA